MKLKKLREFREEVQQLDDDWVKCVSPGVVLRLVDALIADAEQKEEVVASTTIVWDLETTGFVAPEAKILEIGCFVIRDGEIERKHWVLQNNVEIPDKIVEITGITKEIVEKEGRDPKECLLEFIDVFTGCDMNITHNGIKFDIPFFVNYAADVLGWTLEYKTKVEATMWESAFDTAVHFKSKKLGMEQELWCNESYLSFAKRVLNARKKGVHYNLGLCVEEAGIELDLVQHRAMADVELTYELFKTIEDGNSKHRTS